MGGGRCVDSLPLAPSEWPQDVHKRSQDTIPAIFGCKRAVLQKCLFSFRKPGVFEGRVAKLRNVFPSEAATASHLDGNKLMRSLGNTPSALNIKKSFRFFPSSLFGADPFLRHPAGPGANKPCCQSVADVQKASFGDLWRPFL